MRPVILIHGGAGDIKKERIPEKRRKAYRQKLQEAMDSGYSVLEKGGAAVDAVEAAIVVMEDSPLFNAGKGSVFTHDEMNEMDASIMRGSDKNAGSVAGVTTIRNPIKGARKVMTASKHVMLARKGAEEFAVEHDVDTVDPSYFRTEKRLEYLRKVKEKTDDTKLDHDSLEGYSASFDKFGTVGAVALDKEGHLAAGTSTGGMTNKKFARIGDSPIIGAGTYANDRTCAVSATGHGEYFMRNLVAYDIAARMDYLEESVEEAGKKVIRDKLEELGGTGGVIALDSQGNAAFPFNTSGMFRGMKRKGKEWVRMFGKE
ncbi:MAG: isoaspartyl peptidase/L-asparaginase family protein [Flavobacteriales bacterium]